MAVWTRANWTLKAGASSRLVLPRFLGLVTGNPVDFSGAVASLFWALAQGANPPALEIGSLPTPNGQVLLNFNGEPGYIAVDITAMASTALQKAGPLLQHGLKVTWADGSEDYPVVGSTATFAGW
jgi:hypothetical protein